MADVDLNAARLAKLAELERSGEVPFPAGFRTDMSVHAARARFEPMTAEALEAEQPAIRVAGRLTGLRTHGKSHFADLSDGRSQLQLLVRQNVLGEEQFERWCKLDVGDFVGVDGRLLRTRTGELSIEPREFVLLSKAIRPLPEKWHGVRDVETRYRQRYLDLLANPESREVFEKRAAILRRFRAHLESNGFIEAETPLLQPLHGGAEARPFVTHHNTLGIDLYLRIAPELYLKRLLVGGFERVYDLNRNFRNEGISRQHNPEFTMLEFYAAYWDYEVMMEFAEELICVALEDGGGGVRTYQGEELNLARPWQRLSLQDALVEIGGLSPETAEDIGGLREELSGRGVDVAAASYGELREAALDKFVKPQIMSPVFVTMFPRETSPLSKSSPDQPDLVERFELYIAGMEVANGYSELNDPREQRLRMLQQVGASGAKEELPQEVDEDYVVALEHGMPPAAGIGIGVDRLVMVATDVPSIRDVILFPTLRPRN